MLRLYVLMSVYYGDRPEWLRLALSSLDQPGVDRILIGVDGKIDLTLRTVLETQKKLNRKLEVVDFPQTRGLAFVLNDLIDIALVDTECTFIARFDADDVCLPHRFVTQAKFMVDHPSIDVSGGWATLIDEHGSEAGLLKKPSTDQEMKRVLALSSPLIHPTVIVRSSLFRVGLRYPTKTVRFEDVALWISAVARGGVFANMEQALIRYRFTPETLSRRLGVRKAFTEAAIRLPYAFGRPYGSPRLALRVIALLIGKSIIPAWLFNAWQTVSRLKDRNRPSAR